MKNNLLNEQGKKSWFENNYFWACTLGFIVINFVMWFVFGTNTLASLSANNQASWTDKLNFTFMFRSLFNSFVHNSFSHVLLNMVCLFIVGAYLERKIGSVKFALLIFASAFFTSMAITANALTVNYRGFSGVMYALYAYVLIDYIILCCSKQKRNKLNLTLGGVLLGIIYVAMCFNSETRGFDFYPSGLTNNIGHYAAIVAGIILTLVIKVAQIKPKQKA